MKVVNASIRPVGYVTLELSDVELQSLVDTIDQIQMIMNRHPDDIGGTRGELYKQFKELLKVVK